MTATDLNIRGDVTTASPGLLDPRRRRESATSPAVRASVSAIIARVGTEGDAALRRLARELDGVSLDELEVPRREWDRALRELDPELVRVLERAAANLATVHGAFRPRESTVVTADGAIVGRRPDPLARAGVYAPGGRASYPSSLLMAAVPARVAGVGEVCVCSPPASDGLPSPVVRAAAAIAGVDRLFAVGGAGAIAALAYGTATIPAVDVIVGPGNAYVAEAKLQVARDVRIDSPAGPSELLVVADESASPEVVAREMLAQAEHDPDASVMLVALSQGLLDAIEACIARLLAAEPRAATIRAALAARGALLRASSLDEAMSFANAFAPEHLLLVLEEGTLAPALAASRAAGAVFVGGTSSVAFGDYLTGSNHVLPTGGYARTHAGLSTSDFMRWTSWQRVDRAAAASLAADVATFAMAEGLPAHANAARQWEVA